jgi:hypothetical protein
MVALTRRDRFSVLNEKKKKKIAGIERQPEVEGGLGDDRSEVVDHDVDVVRVCRSLLTSLLTQPSPLRPTSLHTRCNCMGILIR